MFAWRKKKHLSGDINVCININVWREDSLVMSVELLVVYIGNVHIQCEVLKKKKKKKNQNASYGIACEKSFLLDLYYHL